MGHVREDIQEYHLKGIYAALSPKTEFSYSAAQFRVKLCGWKHQMQSKAKSISKVQRRT